MSKYFMNKNVNHNGNFYAQGQEMSEKDAGFKELLQNGHMDVQQPKHESKVEAQVEVSSEEKYSKKKK